MYSVPIIVNCRDRLDPLLQLVTWLENAGCTQLILLDNDSTWPPLLAYLDDTPHTVVRLDHNEGYRAPWTSGVVERFAAGGRYVVTDPDVVPDEHCPPDAVLQLWRILDLYPDYPKAGLGLRTDDLPDCYEHRELVRAWERQFTFRPLTRRLYHAPIDTTFALYREGAGYTRGPAIRTGRPYLARHLPWYVDSSSPSAEDLHYAGQRRAGTGSWSEMTMYQQFSENRHKYDLGWMDRLKWTRYAASQDLKAFGYMLRRYFRA